MPDFIKSALTNTVIEYLNGNDVSLTVSVNDKDKEQIENE